LLKDKEVGDFSFTQKQLMTNKLVDEITLRSYNYYTSNTDTKYSDKKDYAFCENAVYSCLGHNDGQFDPRKQHIVAPEKKFDIEIREPWARIFYNNEVRYLSIKGTMDLIVQIDENTYEYVDYKTGQRKNWATDEVKTYEKLHDDVQLLLYYYALRKLYPDKNVIMTIFYLRDGGPFSLCFDDHDETKFLKILEKKFVEIKNCVKPRPVSRNRTANQCRYCFFSRNNWKDTDKTICQHVDDTVRVYGIENALSSLTKPGFKIDYYSAPGSVQKKDK
jgi:hypothetical protein